MQRDPGSFRDPESTVFYSDGRVLRGLTDRGARDWERVRTSRFLRAMAADGSIVGTRQVHADEIAAGEAGWSAVLEHDAVPCVSYPFEWTFAMLRDAALLHLRILLRALDEDISMKDGSAFNVQWRGSRPTFIDLSSFVPAGAGPWVGYRQFCETFLNPLLLQAYRGVDFQPVLKGHLDGIPLATMRRLLSGRDLLRAGALRHVVLQSRLQDTTTASARATKAELEQAGFGREVRRATVASLLRLVEGLEWRPPRAGWARYSTDSPYSGQDRASKADFVDRSLRGGPGVVLDVGCNDGTYSRIAARHAGQVVAVDRDHATVDRLYRQLAVERATNLLPLVVDVANPTPALGWSGAERPAFHDRVRPDLVLCLALVHHLAIPGSVPLPRVVEWLRSFDAAVVVEFVPPEDPQVRRLLDDKTSGHHDYRTDHVESLLPRHFSKVDFEQLDGGRRLYHLAPA